MTREAGLNPCCSGQWSRTAEFEVQVIRGWTSLNPCCSGQWSRTDPSVNVENILPIVLILVVVDNGLVHIKKEFYQDDLTGLNPCCSERWSRTYEINES